MITQENLINTLSIIVLFGFIIALVYLIMLLYQANRIIAKVDHLSETFKKFVSEIVPAMINVSTIANTVEQILRRTEPDHHENHPSKKRKIS